MWRLNTMKCYVKLAGARLACLLVVILVVAASNKLLANAIDSAKVQEQNPNINPNPNPNSNQTTNSETENQTHSEPANLIESLNERLVKQSNLQAEESRQDELIEARLPAPQTSQGQQAAPTEAPIRQQSPGSYWSMSRDGSNRYEFGFDTKSSRSHEAAGEFEEPKRHARLMREESRLADGTVIGRYGYTDPFNVFRVVQYVAGTDGYFAAEDVGGLASEHSLVGPGRRMQLNRQLFKALEQAREQRRARSNLAAKFKLNPKPTVASPQTERQNDTLEGHESSIVDDETLQASDSSRSFGFSLRINHLTGSDGHSYATAFRPSYQANLGPQQVLQHQTAVDQNPRVESLRSKLPAPIYAPFQSQHHAQYAQFGTHSQPSSASSSRSVAQPLAHHWSQPKISKLQSSPAWSILNDNYNKPQVLIVDHRADVSTSDSTRPQTIASQLISDIESNFNREASLLRSLQTSQLAKSQARQVFGSRASVQQSTNIALADVNSASEQNYASPTHFGVAMKHFDAPLYSPEVHEMAHSSQSEHVEPPTAIYSSTVIHSEVASEQQYQPERLSSKPLSNAFESTDLSDMETDTSEQVAAYSSSANMTSRAKIPDRSKRLQSIFKARQNQVNNTTSNKDSSGGNPSLAKIRRLILPATKDTSNEAYVTSAASGTKPPNAAQPDTSQPSVALFATTTSQPNTTPFNSLKSSNRVSKFHPGGIKLYNNNNNNDILAQDERSNSAGNTSLRAQLKPTGSMQISLINQATTASPNTQVENQTATPQIATSFADINSSSEKPRAVIVGFQKLDQLENGNGSRYPALDNALYEKIISIQREIMDRKSSNSLDSATEFPASVNSSQLPEVETSAGLRNSIISMPASSQPNIDSSSSKANHAESTDITSENRVSITESSNLLLLNNTSANQEDSQSTTNSSSSSTTTTEPTQESDLSLNANSYIAEPKKSDDISNNKVDAKPVSVSSQASKFSTGTVMTIEASMDQGELLSRLAQDMNSFDSTRSAPSVTESSSSKAANLSTTTPSVLSTETIDFSNITSQSVFTIDSTNTTNNASITIESKFETEPSTTTIEPIYTTIQSFQPSSFKPDVITWMAEKPDTNQTTNKIIVEETNKTTTIAPVTTTMVNLTTQPTTLTSTERQAFNATPTLTIAVPAGDDMTHKNQINKIHESQKNHSNATRSSPPRFGRLVIKRGDKVVARFNASEPIPDSMIPIHGQASSNGTDMILPDLPRLGMRIRNRTKRLGFDLVRRKENKTKTSGSSVAQDSKEQTTSSPTLTQASNIQ